MELARTLKTLWQRRRLVVLGAVLAGLAALFSVYRIGLAPPSLESRTNVFAAASTQILVDTPDSAFANVASSIDPLQTRASVFARFLATPAAVRLIARTARLPADGIEAQGPYELNVPTFSQGPTAEKRSSQIVGERALYRLRFENNPDLPIISVFSQAPGTDEAVALASAAPAALRDYIERLQEKQGTPANRRVEIRALGRATGGVVNSCANVQIAALVFLAVLAGWCMLLIPANTIARGWREIGDPPDPAVNGGSRANGSGAGHDQGLPRPDSTPEEAH
jgi:hypothetical protein